MKQTMRTRGKSFVKVIATLGIVIILAVVGITGWRALYSTSSNEADASPSRSAEVITTKADLEAAEKALDDLDFEDDAAAKAEEQANL